MTTDQPADGLRVTLVAPLHGRAILRLRAGAREFEFPFSYTPDDSLERLVEVVDATLTERSDRVVTLHGGPQELDVHLLRTGSNTELRAVLYADHRRQGIGEVVLLAEGEARGLARSVWRAMRDIEGSIGLEEYARQWHHPYPTRAVALLGQHLDHDDQS